MAIPNTMKVPVPWDFVAPHGVLFLGVDRAVDFDRRGQADDQERDKETGKRVWLVRGVDLDPEAGKFGASKELKIRVIADVQPVPPEPEMPGYPPMVEFTDVTITPWVDSQKCKAPEHNKPHKCRARMGWSIRATGMTAPQQTGKPAKAA
ncbi:hypothetical protein EV385_2604 [Krasilnikovia cinnamomea]|uniref:Plasmid replication, integration and excision activator n=1 Tax=Krasilnikovia cinnamomea TaxID=349313 RepID=A0A4Q7ZIY1_9ACTN|nr:hypothetical protein [Krasilnikovia cinnamomea]RZU50818.1 hypothetical protein EV385_2604 [Krasilnikovia cinnamomea]